jgi:hypothetical protein
VVDKTGVEDDRLSWKARGLLVFLLSKPDNWEVYTAYLVKSGPDGRASVLSGLRELEAFSYIQRVRNRSSDGTWDGTDVHVFETPQAEIRTVDGPTADRLSAGGKPAGGKSTQREELQVVITDETEELLSASASPSQREVAKRILDDFLSSQDPKPVQSPIAIQKRIEECLEANYSADAIAIALPTMSAFTRDAFDFTLRKKPTSGRDDGRSFMHSKLQDEVHPHADCTECDGSGFIHDLDASGIGTSIPCMADLTSQAVTT